MISFDVSLKEHNLINAIAEKAVTLNPFYKKFSVAMDVTMVHASGCRLDLEALLDADVVDFRNEIDGIAASLDRDNGKLWEFTPRFELKDE